MISSSTMETVSPHPPLYTVTTSCLPNLVEPKDTKDLPYCGRVPEHLTHTKGRTRFYTECLASPSIGYQDMHNIKMYREEVDLDLTCVVPNATYDGSDVTEDGSW